MLANGAEYDFGGVIPGQDLSTILNMNPYQVANAAAVASGYIPPPTFPNPALAPTSLSATNQIAQIANSIGQTVTGVVNSLRYPTLFPTSTAAVQATPPATTIGGTSLGTLLVLGLLAVGAVMLLKK